MILNYFNNVKYKSLKQTVSLKQFNFSNYWIKNGFFIIIFSIVINHFTAPENFPFNKNYQFPLIPIIASIIGGSIAIIIASFNFKYFKNKYFIEKIDTKILLRFLFSTLGCITIFYIPFYYVSNFLVNGKINFNFYYLLNGLLVSLLIDTVLIFLLFSSDIYKLHKLNSIQGILKVQQSGKITLIKHSEIAFMFSENKIVYIVKTDGALIMTDFTLNEIESKVNEQSFFRTNRQTIIHPSSIEQIQSIENGKLSVLLKPAISNEESLQINISRYKKQAFMNWFENKT